MIRIALLVMLAGCRVTGEFVCKTDDQCKHGDQIGWCEANGNCTFTDTACPTQRRFDDNSAAEVANACLEGVVTGRIRERVFVNDEMRRPRVEDHFAVAGKLTPSAMLEDGTAPAVSYRDSDGTFSFANPKGQHYELRYTIDDRARAVQHFAPHLELAPDLAGRVDRAELTKQTTLAFAQTPALSGQVTVASTGVWTETITGASGSSSSINWLMARSLSGKLGLLDANKFDRVYYLLFGPVLGYSAITAYASYDVTLVENTQLTASGTLTSVTNRNLCVNVAHQGMTEIDRMKMVHPSTTAGAHSWQLQAVPGRDITPNFGFMLAVGTAMTPTNAATAMRYINPYPGTTVLASQYVSGKVSIGYMTNSGTDFLLDAFVALPADPTDASCATEALLHTTAALQGDITVAGTAVDAADKPITLPANAPNIIVTWTAKVAGPAHDYTVLLHELSDDGVGGTTRESRGVFDTSEPRVMIPASLLQSGHEYVLQFWTLLGYPNAAAGDYTTLTYPFEYTTSYSQTFRIN